VFPKIFITTEVPGKTFQLNIQNFYFHNF
jgi:hypothetical protein